MITKNPSMFSTGKLIAVWVSTLLIIFIGWKIFNSDIPESKIEDQKMQEILNQTWERGSWLNDEQFNLEVKKVLEEAFEEVENK